MPDEVKETRIVPDYHDDYHGNFDADLFERLFERLCKKLQQKYGSCHIHMDGAKYHMRRKNDKQTGNASRQTIIDWYHSNRYRLPNGTRNNTLSVKELKKKRVDELDHSPTWPTYEIARKYGHKVRKISPYHCELQPTEHVWGIVKNRIAFDLEENPTAGSVRTRFLQAFARIDHVALRSVWKKAVDQYKVYQGGHENGCVLVGPCQEFGAPDISNEEEYNLHKDFVS